MRVAYILLLALIVAGCADVQARGDQLVVDLSSAFSDRISAISFENAPPMDPPTLFIDIDPPMEPGAEKTFLCEEIAPMVHAAGGGIDVTTTYGWHISDCP